MFQNITWTSYWKQARSQTTPIGAAKILAGGGAIVTG